MPRIKKNGKCTLKRLSKSNLNKMTVKSGSLNFNITKASSTTHTSFKTERQLANDVKIQKDMLIQQAIINKVEMGMSVKLFADKGRGVIAEQEFRKDDFVVEYAGDLVDCKAAKEREKSYKLTKDVGCYMYHFIHQGRRYCIDATAETGRLGRLINHSRMNANCYTKVIPILGQPHLVLFAKRTIFPGEELLYDYGERDKDTIEALPWLKS